MESETQRRKRFDEEATAILTSDKSLYDVANKVNVIEIPTGQGAFCKQSLGLAISDPSLGLGHLFSPITTPLGHGENYANLGRRAIYVCVEVHIKSTNNIAG